MNRRHLLVLAVGVVAVSWAAPLIRLAAAPALLVAALRLVFAAPPVVGAAMLRRRDELRRLRAPELLLMAFAGLALALHFAFWVASVQRTSVVTSVVLVATQPLFVGLGAWATLGERPRRGLLLGVAVAASGMALLAGADLGERGSLVGDGFALLGAVFASVYLIAGRHARRGLSNLTYVSVVNVVAAAMLLAMLFASGTAIGGHQRDAYLYILALAAVPQLVGHSALTWVLGHVPAVLVATAILGEPVGATLIAATLLDEMPTLLQWSGAALALAGIYLALRVPAALPAVVATGERGRSERQDEGVRPWVAR